MWMAVLRSVRISWATVFSKRSRGAPPVLDVSRSYSIVPSSSPCHGPNVTPWAFTAADHPRNRLATTKPAERLGARTSPAYVTACTGGEADAPCSPAVVAGSAGLAAGHRVVGDRRGRRGYRARVA